MSQENVELVRAGVDAFNRRDLDGFVASLSPDVVWEENPQLPGLREIYRGRAQVREWIDEILEAVETIHNEIVEITELRDDRVFTENVVTGRGTGSGVPVELRYGRSAGSRRARSQGVRSFGTKTKPSKPPGFRDRRCRKRTSRSCGR
jgi:ketosteroid isomerase-like protein